MLIYRGRPSAALVPEAMILVADCELRDNFIPVVIVITDGVGIRIS
jgi:hypothetical protein